ncbi:MAG: response regulator transcription factor [Acidimicrobiales bacterium]|nr:response regulator transcription factor [Acidimicrobiales bacterium]
MTELVEVIRVMVVDDHSLVREGICELLEHHVDIEVVAKAASAKEALDLAKNILLDVALVDVRLPDRSGISIIKELREMLPDCHILIVSAYDDHDYMIEALAQGANGYLLKTSSSEELAGAIKVAASGATVLDNKLALSLAKNVQSGRNSLHDGLTKREREVLGGLARGLANKQIASELGVGIRTIEGHVTELFNKLSVTSRTEAALWAVNKGIATNSGET